MNRPFATILLSLSFLTTFAQQKHYPLREFRAAWITTVANIDWPSQRTGSPGEQQEELAGLLHKFEQMHFNAVVMQVRPAADAFYKSSYEPWSEYLTGKQGKEPNPFYDPLEFAIRECRKRNLEFHAWFNPFRAVANLKVSDVHPQHVSNRYPHWFFTYGGKKYFNPGVPEARSFIVEVIMEVVKNYDIDAVHFDDYFYPYKIKGEEIDDEAAYRRYGQGLGRADWRRQNINQFIQALSDSILVHKPHVKFGISPVGAWRNQSEDPRGSATRVGQPAYDYLYADIRKWLEEGWIDYVAPQLYWSTASRYGSYEVLTHWWHKNSFGKHIYTGNAIFKIGEVEDDKTWLQPAEFSRQMRINREYSAIKGAIFFSTKSVFKNPLGLQDTLRRNFFKRKALVPTMPWKDPVPPNPPRNLKASIQAEGHLLEWQSPEAASDGDSASYYLVYRFENEFKVNLQDTDALLSVQRACAFLDKEAALAPKRYVYVVVAIDKMHNESEDYAFLAFSAFSEERRLTNGSPVKEKD